MPNAAPTLSSISAQTVDELQTLTFTASATDTAGQTITYSIDGTSLGATINPTTGVFSWTPTEQQGPDTHQVTITATDNGSPQMSDSETVTITVTEVNTPPVLAAIGPKSVTAGSALAITLSATDVDLPANTLTYSDNVTFGTLTGASFAWTPSTSDIGQHTVRFTVSDGASGGSDHEDVVITVSAVPNAAPTLSSISAQTVDELQTLTFTASATDTAGQTITYSLSGQRPGATINPTTGVFSWTPTEQQGPDTHQVTITATDNGSPQMSDSETVTITVTEVNTPPVLAAIGPKSVTAGSALAITLSATDVDLPANTLTYSDNVTFGTLTGASFAWTPSTSDIGQHTVRFTVSDGASGGSDHEDVVITVSAVPNAAPTLSSISAQTVDELQTLTFTASATDTAGQTITYSIDGTSLGATINPTTGVFSWTPTEQQGPGTHHIRITATDSGSPSESDSKIVTITVRDVNQIPTLGVIGPLSATAGSALTIMLSATDPDVPANTLTYSRNGSLGTINNNVFAWTPSSLDVGSHAIRFTVSDGNGGTDHEDVTITVSSALNTPSHNLIIDSLTIVDADADQTNPQPILALIGPKTVAVDSVLVITLLATDLDSPVDTLTYTRNGSLGSLASNTFTWTPSSSDVGNHIIRFTVSDNNGGIDHEDVTITVSPTTTPNAAPQIRTITSKTVDEDETLTFAVPATDPDAGQTLTYTTNATSLGATVNSTGFFVWMPGASHGPGTYHIAITVIDDGAPRQSASVTVAVTVNAANLPSTTSSDFVPQAFSATASTETNPQASPPADPAGSQDGAEASGGDTAGTNAEPKSEPAKRCR